MKAEVIKANQDKYSISAMCSVLKIPRSTYYYEINKSQEKPEDEYAEDVISVFKASRRNYGTRRIKKELTKQGKIISRRRIGRIVRNHGLVSNYTVAKYKVHKSKVNEAAIENIINRKFNERASLEVVVSDLTYVRVDVKWNYVCFILDLNNREIIGYSAGRNKTADLVHKAFTSIKSDLKNIKIFHTDRGNEFKNHTIDKLLNTFNISRSLSHKGR